MPLHTPHMVKFFRLVFIAELVRKYHDSKFEFLNLRKSHQDMWISRICIAPSMGRVGDS